MWHCDVTAKRVRLAQLFRRPHSQITSQPAAAAEAEILPYMLKCSRQLTDSWWFGSNWNTGDWERLRDSSPVLMEYSWTCCQDWSCSIKCFCARLGESDFFHPSASFFFFLEKHRLRMNFLIYVSKIVTFPLCVWKLARITACEVSNKIVEH